MTKAWSAILVVLAVLVMAASQMPVAGLPVLWVTFMPFLAMLAATLAAAAHIDMLELPKGATGALMAASLFLVTTSQVIKPLHPIVAIVLATLSLACSILAKAHELIVPATTKAVDAARTPPPIPKA